LPGKFHNGVNIGINNKFDHLIVGKPTQPVTVSLPVPVPNITDINPFLEDDSMVEEELIN
jgi:hypothetical protein